ncbi:hypothetical protein ACN28E_03045 [Archangium lansingense]|uniref:DUF4438 family protein n=1 Tax=Archangium lansingense TaxID=2995310 RepID=UPI003B7E81D8
MVALCNMGYRHGATRNPDRVTVGVVVHTDSHVAGHGPGVTPLLTGSMRHLRLVREPRANLALVLGLRRQVAPGAQDTREHTTGG